MSTSTLRQTSDHPRSKSKLGLFVLPSGTGEDRSSVDYGYGRDSPVSQRWCRPPHLGSTRSLDRRGEGLQSLVTPFPGYHDRKNPSPTGRGRTEDEWHSVTNTPRFLSNVKTNETSFGAIPNSLLGDFSSPTPETDWNHLGPTREPVCRHRL